MLPLVDLVVRADEIRKVLNGHTARVYNIYGKKSINHFRIFGPSLLSLSLSNIRGPPI